MKKILAFVICLIMLLQTATIAEEEVSLEDALNTKNPNNTAEEQKEPQPSESPKIKNPIEYAIDGSFSLIISAVGDITIGGDRRSGAKTLFDKEMEKNENDPSYIVKNTAELFAGDHLTIANFESLLTDADLPSNMAEYSGIFSAPAEYVNILKNWNIEAVSFENNHSMDYGPQGRQDTIDALNEAGIVWSDANNIGVYSVNGVDIAMLSYQSFNVSYEELEIKIANDIMGAKKNYDIIIISFHWGDDLSYSPNKEQQKLGRAAIDAGADLIIGHHSQRINPIEIYKGKYIVYSLGSFSFAGNTRINDMNTFIFQVKFVIKDNKASSGDFRIIPARISSKSGYNDFIPSPYSDTKSIKNVISLLNKNGRQLQNAVEDYPIDWE